MTRSSFLLPLLAVGAMLAGAALAEPPANPNYNPPPPKKGYSYPECYCTGSQGERVELGQTACLSIGEKRVLARCDMSVNNPTWRYLAEGCPGV
ncbi:MAG: hypothetical protein KatS3mg118_2787 [Paracoccaceae bacterium]|nr:MAG: hypothetical protein KatS3mg118_2787 [Paracoccaceae bacterium]